MPAKTAATVWGTSVQRAGGEVSVIQEIADTKTAAQATLSEVRDMRAKQANEIWLAPLTGVDPASGETQVHPAVEWVTVAAFRIAAGQNPAAVVEAIPAEIAQSVLDLLAERLKD